MSSSPLLPTPLFAQNDDRHTTLPLSGLKQPLWKQQPLTPSPPTPPWPPLISAANAAAVLCVCSLSTGAAASGVALPAAPLAPPAIARRTAPPPRRCGSCSGSRTCLRATPALGRACGLAGLVSHAEVACLAVGHAQRQPLRLRLPHGFLARQCCCPFRDVGATREDTASTSNINSFKRTVWDQPQPPWHLGAP